MSATRTTLRTEHRVFDVDIADTPTVADGRPTTFREITVRVGGEPGGRYGHQVLSLRLRPETSMAQVLRDWAEAIELLPAAIMEHAL